MHPKPNLLQRADSWTHIVGGVQDYLATDSPLVTIDLWPADLNDPDIIREWQVLQ